ncbi:MAG: hypothetical protein ACRDF4_08645 [Rhabdochlamydiaceae bacterium]
MMIWLQNNHRANGYQTLSKFLDSILSEYIKSKTLSKDADRPLTPQEECDTLIEEMGKLNERFDDKFAAIRSLIPKDHPQTETEADLKKLIVLIWTKISERNGFVRFRNKGIAISRADLEQYEQLGLLHLRKKELTKGMIEANDVQ